MDSIEVAEKNFLELEYTHPKDKNIKNYLLVEQCTKKIWIDTNGLPEKATLCAMHDAETQMRTTVGAQGEEKERWFLDIDWVINEWGGPEDLVQVIKDLKEPIKPQIEEFCKENNG